MRQKKTFFRGDTQDPPKYRRTKPPPLILDHPRMRCGNGSVVRLACGALAGAERSGAVCRLLPARSFGVARKNAFRARLNNRMQPTRRTDERERDWW